MTLSEVVLKVIQSFPLDETDQGPIRKKLLGDGHVDIAKVNQVTVLLSAPNKIPFV